MSMTRKVVLLGWVVVVGCGKVEEPADDLGSTERALASPCSASKVAEVLEAATAATASVRVSCSLDLSASAVITKQLIIEGAGSSGATIDCHGARLNGGSGTVNDGHDMILVRTRRVVADDGTVSWDRPTDITVRNCTIVGSVRVRGMTVDDLRESSHTDGHATRSRDRAPKAVALENLHITGTGRIPVYFEPGVSYSRLLDSEIDGSSTSVAIYLDAESTRNTLQRNSIHPSTGRELVAIDGSSSNLIIDNYFSSLSLGGLYLYRNCGERGVIRHATPSSNTIVNNAFYYDQYTGGNPSVYLASRDGPGGFLGIGGRGYCDDDSGYPYGSSASDLDYARYNVVMQNQIYKRSASDMILTQNPDRNVNYVAYNSTVTSAVSRLAGCYVKNGYLDFVTHGRTATVVSGNPAECETWSCSDGVLSRSGTCTAQAVGFTCRATGNNSGCNGPVACPSGTSVVGVGAACDLETGTVEASSVASVDANQLFVERASDNESDGSCWAGRTTVRSGTAVVRGSSGDTRVVVGCKEYDGNGGDCEIRGAVYCR